jgi:hypothetical protein
VEAEQEEDLAADWFTIYIWTSELLEDETGNNSSKS